MTYLLPFKPQQNLFRQILVLAFHHVPDRHLRIDVRPHGIPIGKPNDLGCSALDDTDTAIFNLLEDGKTQREIAAALGYKTPSAVSKRIRAIQKKYEEFTKDDDE